MNTGPEQQSYVLQEAIPERGSIPDVLKLQPKMATYVTGNHEEVRHIGSMPLVERDGIACLETTENLPFVIFLGLDRGYAHHQGDSIGLYDIAYTDEQGNEIEQVLIIDADGVGSYLDDKGAALLATTRVLDFYTYGLEEYVYDEKGNPLRRFTAAEALGYALERINEEFYQTNKREGQRHFAAACSAAVIDKKGHFIVAKSGDTKELQITDEEVTQLTDMHSNVWNRYKHGQIPLGQTYTDPNSNKLYAALGFKENPDILLAEGQLEPGDILFLCSDGLWRFMGKQYKRGKFAGGNYMVGYYLNNSSGLQAAGQNLFRFAMQNGSDDSMSFIGVYRPNTTEEIIPDEENREHGEGEFSAVDMYMQYPMRAIRELLEVVEIEGFTQTELQKLIEEVLEDPLRVSILPTAQGLRAKVEEFLVNFRNLAQGIYVHALVVVDKEGNQEVRLYEIAQDTEFDENGNCQQVTVDFEVFPNHFQPETVTYKDMELLNLLSFHRIPPMLKQFDMVLRCTIEHRGGVTAIDPETEQPTVLSTEDALDYIHDYMSEAQDKIHEIRGSGQKHSYAQLKEQVKKALQYYGFPQSLQDLLIDRVAYTMKLLRSK